MLKWILATATTLAVFGGVHAHANDFIGWCFASDACVGPSRITRQGFETCEETCSMNNPVSVRGLNATLYDVVCRGDWGGYEHRMLFMKYADGDGNQRALAVGPNGSEELERCR